MDVNFNSLAEEQKEPSGIGFAGNETNAEVTGCSEEGQTQSVHGCLEDSGIADKRSLEKLAELTAAMNRFELEIVSAENPPRVRSKSEPSTYPGCSPKTVVVTPCNQIDENFIDHPVPSENCVTTSAKLPPPAASSERKRRVELLPSRAVVNASKTSCVGRHEWCRQIQEQWRGKLMMDSNTANGEVCSGYIWTGEVPPRNYSNPTFSNKIFVGGVPWNITETALVDAFSPYGACKVEWPSKEVRSRSNLRNRGKVTGYVYMIFETERSVKSLLQDCSQQFGSAGEWYFTLKARRNQSIEFRQVQIIPWVVSDSSYFDDPSCRLDPTKTVFVGALHGMITAQVLFSIMNDLYDDVVFAGIDTDKHKYPIGKKVQIDPFLEDAWCMVCCKAHGPYFCRDRTCFRYYCGACWQARHTAGGNYANHRPLMRHAPRSMTLRNDAHENNAETHTVPTLQRYLSVPTNMPVAPLGGLAAVAAVARGTVPRQQYHAYQYMQLALPYPATVYTSTMPQRQCHVSPSAASTPLISGINHPHPINTSSPYIHQRLY